MNNENNLNQNNNYNGFNNQILNNGVNNTNDSNGNQVVSSNDFKNLNSNLNWNVSNNTNSNNQYNGYNNPMNENLTNNQQQNSINQFQTNINQNQNYQYTMNNQNGGNINNDNNKQKKSKKFWICLFAIEIVLFVVLNIIMYGGAISTYTDDERRSGCTANEFIAILKNQNYNVENLTESQDDHLYYEAKKQNLNISFFEYPSNEYAYEEYLYFKDAIQEKEGFRDYYANEESKYYNRYEVTTNGLTYIVARKDNTVVFSIVSSIYSEDINQLFEELGYSGNQDFNMANFITCFLILFISIYTLMLVIYWKIFVKSGYKGWKSLIPIYNIYLMFKIAFGKGWYFLFMFIPLVNFVIIFVLLYKLAKNFGKSTAFAICNIFLFIFTMQIIAFDESEYLLKK